MSNEPTVYLLHFERSFKHARHYLGWTENLEQRLHQHRAGRGSPLVAAAIADGISFQLAATWPGSRTDERRLHRQKNSPARLCPICKTEVRQPPAALADEFIVDAIVELGEPVTLPALGTYLQRGGRQPVGSLYGRLELLVARDRVRKAEVLGEPAWGPAQLAA